MANITLTEEEIKFTLYALRDRRTRLIAIKQDYSCQGQDETVKDVGKDIFTHDLITTQLGDVLETIRNNKKAEVTHYCVNSNLETQQQVAATKFLMKFPLKWHTYAIHGDTENVVRVLVSLGIADVNQHHQFRLKIMGKALAFLKLKEDEA